jgi:hypoxia up-regulated 1
VLAVVCALVLNKVEAQIMSVDLGHEFFKVALMRQGAPLEIVLNPHSKRKTATAVSFLEAVRAFGDDAVPHAGKAPSKVPTFFHSQLAHNYSSQDIQAGGLWWTNFALGDKFYAYDLGYDEDRGVPTFKFGSEKEFSAEEVLANILYFAKTLAAASADGKPVKDAVVTVPPNANMRYRQAVVAAGEIAGLRVLTLVHEGSAFAVQRAIDYAPEKGNVEYGLFYNMGSRKTEVTIVQMESRQAGMVAGKTAPVVTVVGSAIDMNIGGHLMDLKIASAMLKKFQEKYKNLAEGIAQNPRALKKLVGQAQKTKAVLSANKQGHFAVESLYEDTDFQTQIARSEFEQMCQDMFDQLTNPVKKALDAANITLADVNHVELVGGAWRVPKVQQILSEYFEKESGKNIPLGQHLNGEEASALGAALVGANSSSSFRVKKIFFSDVSSHSYAVQVVSPAGEKNLTTLYPVGAPLGSKKKLSFSLEEDFQIKLFEDGVLLSEYSIAGLEDVLKGKWAEYNLTGAPKVNVAVHLETSGIIELKTPTATCEETYWANETKKIPKQNNATNTSDDSNETNESELTNSTNNTSNKSKAEEFDVEVIQVKKKRRSMTKNLL